MKSIFLFLSLIICFGLLAQENHYKIEFDAFSPDAGQMIKMMENNPADSFEGTSMEGEELLFEKMNDRPMLLWFWDVKDELSIGQIDGLNLMSQMFESSLHTIGFAYDKRPFVDIFLNEKSVDFHVIPNAFKLGELRYGSELGQGRIFLVDRKGIVRKAIPRSFFVENQNSFNQLRIFISELINE